MTDSESPRFDIDPVRYGVLWQKVNDYERRLEEMSKKMDHMEKQLSELVALANKGAGGMWVGMGLVSAFSTLVGYITHVVANK